MGFGLSGGSHENDWPFPQAAEALFDIVRIARSGISAAYTSGSSGVSSGKPGYPLRFGLVTVLELYRSKSIYSWTCERSKS